MIYTSSKTILARTTPLAPILLLCSLLAATPVWACCDNVFSCAAAVVTYGATCLIDLAASALRITIQLVEQERESKRRGFTNELMSSQHEAQAAAENLKQKANERAEDLNRSLDEAKRITGEDKAWINTVLQPSAVQQPPDVSTATAVPNGNFSEFKQLSVPGIASVPKPTINPFTQRTAPSSTIRTEAVTVEKATALDQATLHQLLQDTSLETLRRQIEVEQQRGEASHKRALAARKNAERSIAESTQSTNTVFQNSFLGPVDQLLAALQGALRNPLEAGKLITVALGILDGAFTAFDRDVVPAVERDAQIKQTEVARVKREADQTERHAEKAKRILAEMRKVVQLKTVVERRSLVNATNATSPVSTTAVTPIISLKSSYRLLATAKNLGPSLLTIRPDLQRLAAQMQPPDLAPIRTKLATNFDQYFQNKKSSEVNQIRDQLILETRRRYSSDPKLLASIEKLIIDETWARGVPNSQEAGAASHQGASLDRKTLQPKSQAGADAGSSQCQAGFVWRLANASDHVCVRPDSHIRVLQENATAASRRNPQGPYGPNTCLTGFVWREAFAGDVVCVTPEIRQVIRQENQLGTSRSTASSQMPGTGLIRPQRTPSQGFGGTGLLRSRGVEEKEVETTAADTEKKP